MKNKFHLLTAVCVSSLLGSAAMAGGDKLQFSTEDRDGNGAISQAEMLNTLQSSELYERIDVNDNGMLEKDEADNDIVEYDEEHDLDRNGSLNRNEFAAAIFSRFDEDDSRTLDADEYEEFTEELSELLES